MWRLKAKGFSTVYYKMINGRFMYAGTKKGKWYPSQYSGLDIAIATRHAGRYKYTLKYYPPVK